MIACRPAVTDPGRLLQVFAKMRRERDEARCQRDALLAALERVLHEVETLFSGPQCGCADNDIPLASRDCTMCQAYAAIAGATTDRASPGPLPQLP